MLGPLLVLVLALLLLRRLCMLLVLGRQRIWGSRFPILWIVGVVFLVVGWSACIVCGGGGNLREASGQWWWWRPPRDSRTLRIGLRVVRCVGHPGPRCVCTYTSPELGRSGYKKYVTRRLSLGSCGVVVGLVSVALRSCLSLVSAVHTTPVGSQMLLGLWLIRVLVIDICVRCIPT